MNDLVLVGGGGHCLSCIATIEREGKHRIAGVLDRNAPAGGAVGIARYLGDDEQRLKWIDTGAEFLITVGRLDGRETVRQNLYKKYRVDGAQFAVIVDSDATLARTAVLGDGTIVLAGARINAEARIGSNVIVNTGAIIEHGTVIGDHSHISTGALVNGDCRIGEGCMIGTGAVLRNGIEIAPGTTVGMGAVVVHSIKEPGTYLGIPARRLSV